MLRHWKTVAAAAIAVTIVTGGVISVDAATGAFNGSVSGIIGIDDEVQVAPGTLDDGKHLLPNATISLKQAIELAQGAESGATGEVDLEYYHDRLVFNVDIGEHDVKVDAGTGDVLGTVTEESGLD